MAVPILARTARRKFEFASAHASMTSAILLPALLIREKRRLQNVITGFM